jgi:hypothetical protein
MEALVRVAPGYPLLLAVAIELFGELAPFWVNPICLGVGLGLLARLLIDDGGDGAEAGLATLWTCLVLLTGYGLNPHFLLYPFRESPAWGLAMAGLWYTHRSAIRNQTTGVAVGGLCLLAACAVREPMAVVVIGVAGWLLNCRGTDPFWRFLVPIGVGGLLGGIFASEQVRYVFARLAGSDASWGEVLATGAAFLGLMFDEVHLFGVGLVLVGLWTGRKRPVLWWFFVVPSVLLVVLHAWLGIHRRYVLMALALVLPVAGVGFARVVALAQQALSARIDGWPDRGLQRITFGMVGIGLCVVSLGLDPWGPRVRRTELRTFKEAVASFANPGDRVYSEWACRHLADALGSFTEVRPAGNPLPIDYTLGLPGTSYFLQPLNEEAFYADEPRVASIRKEHLFRYEADLLPLDGEVSIAGGRFAVHRIAPWSAYTVTNRVYGKQDRRLVIWLDLQATAPAATKRVRILCSSTGKVLLKRDVKEGNGLMVFALDGSRMARRVVDVEVSSETVLPSRVVCHATFDGQPIVFTLLDRRLRSIYDWFQPPFVPMITERKHLAQLQAGGTLRLPPVYGDAQSIEALLTLTPVAGGEGEIKVQYGTPRSDPVTVDALLSAPQMWHGFTASLVDGAATPVTITVEPPDCHGSHLRIEQIKLWVK